MQNNTKKEEKISYIDGKRGWKGRWFGKGGKWKPYIYEAGMYLLFSVLNENIYPTHINKRKKTEK